jgi:hypothetical protein
MSWTARLGLPDEDPRTWANLVTLVRTALGLVVFTIAALRRDATWNMVGLTLYWALDVLDGWLARRLDQETRLGAQLDILSDRVLVAFFYLNHLALHPERALPVALFLLHFNGVDHHLSNQFIPFRLKSPNDFHLVDRTVWLLNFSPAGKALNTGLVTVTMLLVPSVALPTAMTLVLMAVKIWSCHRLMHLPGARAPQAVPA